MYFLSTFLTLLTIAVLVLLSMLGTKNEELKEERARRYELGDENYNLKEKIDELEEDNNFLKEAVMDFKNGKLAKGELIKSVKALINNRKRERLQKIKQENKELKDIIES